MTEIHHAYLVRDRDGEERLAEVIVTGPLEATDVLGTGLAGAQALAV